MRRMRWTLIFAAAAVLVGCGDRHLVVKVDVLSYLDPTVTHFAVGPVPPVPGGLYTGEQPVIQDAEVNLVDGTSSVAEVQTVSIAMSIIAADSTGAGADTLRLYISDPAIDPLTTPPAMVLPAQLTAGVTDTIAVDIEADSRVADLFAGKKMRVTLTTSLRGPDVGGNALNAHVSIRSLDAVLVAGRKGDL